MGTLHLFAIGIDEVRDFFRTSPELAGRLRTSAAHRMAVDNQSVVTRPSLLGRVGPLFRHSIEPAPPLPDGPAPGDVENVLAGRYVAPGRLRQCWQLVEGWLGDESWGDFRQEATRLQFQNANFDFTRAGVSSQFDLGRLMGRDPQVPLRPAEGLTVGYSRFDHVNDTRAALRSAIGQVLPATRPFADALLGFLDRFPEWELQAAGRGRPRPDLFGLWWNTEETGG